MKQNSNIPNEDNLVFRLNNGDPKAGFDLYADALYGMCLKILQHSTGMAEDAFQEALVNTWKNAASYDSKKGKLLTWILNITRNTAIDFYRKMDKRSQIQKDISDVHVTNPNMITTPYTDIIDVSEQLNNLSSDERKVIEMSYFTGLTQQQISGHLDVPLGTVKTWIRRGITKLRKI